jgi:hypothetical protein
MSAYDNDVPVEMNDRDETLLSWSRPSIRRLSLADAEFDIVPGDDGFLGKGTKS